jgi:hypothetical protein
MKKPEWFQLTEKDNPDPTVCRRIPFSVMLAITIAVTAFIFLFPSKTGEQKPQPTIEIIQTPIDLITMPTMSPEEEDNDQDDEDREN